MAVGFGSNPVIKAKGVQEVLCRIRFRELCPRLIIIGIWRGLCYRVGQRRWGQMPFAEVRGLDAKGAGVVSERWCIWVQPV